MEGILAAKPTITLEDVPLWKQFANESMTNEMVSVTLGFSRRGVVTEKVDFPGAGPPLEKRSGYATIVMLLIHDKYNK